MPAPDLPASTCKHTHVPTYPRTYPTCSIVPDTNIIQLNNIHTTRYPQGQFERKNIIHRRIPPDIHRPPPGRLPCLLSPGQEPDQPSPDSDKPSLRSTTAGDGQPTATLGRLRAGIIRRLRRTRKPQANATGRRSAGFNRHACRLFSKLRSAPADRRPRRRYADRARTSHAGNKTLTGFVACSARACPATRRHPPPATHKESKLSLRLLCRGTPNKTHIVRPFASSHPRFVGFAAGLLRALATLKPGSHNVLFCSPGTRKLVPAIVKLRLAPARLKSRRAKTPRARRLSVRVQPPTPHPHAWSPLSIVQSKGLVAVRPSKAQTKRRGRPIPVNAVHVLDMGTEGATLANALAGSHGRHRRSGVTPVCPVDRRRTGRVAERATLRTPPGGSPPHGRCRAFGGVSSLPSRGTASAPHAPTCPGRVASRSHLRSAPRPELSGACLPGIKDHRQRKAVKEKKGCPSHG
jgi:hypothetical protein